MAINPRKCANDGVAGVLPNDPKEDDHEPSNVDRARPASAGGVSGCINVTTKILPDNPSVRKDLVGSDCIAIIFGIGIGTADVALATRQGLTFEDAKTTWPEREPVVMGKVRSVAVTDVQFMSFGSHCIEVTGEADKLSS